MGVVGGLVFVAGGQGTLPAWAEVAAVILVPASAASAFGGLYLSSQLAVRWPMTVGMSVPALIAGYVVLLYLPSLRTVAGPLVLGGAIFGGAVWGAILILSIVLWPAVSRRVRENDARRTVRDKEYAAATAQRNSETRSANLAKVKAMRPDQPLSDWYSLLEPESGVRSEAMEALKTVERRQSDVAYLLNEGIQAPMILVPDLDLNFTLQLCHAAQVFLQKTAEGIRITDRDPHPYQSNKYLEASLRSIPWFTAHGCNCGEGIAEMEDRVRGYVDTLDRRQMLILLAGLKEGH